MCEPAAPVCDLVIISFDYPIEMVKWRMHLVENWAKHMKENTRLLVLAGVHGDQNTGEWTPEDKDKDKFVESSLMQINKWLIDNKGPEIVSKNITLNVCDVGQRDNKGITKANIMTDNDWIM